MNKVICFLVFLLIFACKQESDHESLSLLKYGIPVTIKAPNDVEVKVEDLGVWKDVTIKNDSDFNIQLLASESTTFDLSQILSEQLTTVQQSRYFSKIMDQYDDGFIFEKKIDEDNTNYDFRHIKLSGDKEYIFQTGLLGTFSEEAVRAMYEAVR